MNFEVTIIGANSAVHAFGRFPTCQIVQVNHEPYLVDCGEGSQYRMELFKVKRSKINQIFISHLHGDHYYGLVGFLSTLNLNSRIEPLTVYGPEGLREIVELNFFYSKTDLKYPVDFVVIDTTIHQKIYENGFLEVYTIPLSHKVPTAGFLFKEKIRPNKIIPEMIDKYAIPTALIDSIKLGDDFYTAEGQLILNKELTIPAPSPRSYAYCSDTVFTESILPIIDQVNLLYHESTYLEKEASKAVAYHHTTARQAATIAKKAKVGQLILGHFSSRYESLQEMLHEAQEVFQNAALAQEGNTYLVE